MKFQLSYFKAIQAISIAISSYFIASQLWCYESTALNMPANLENSAVATGLEKVSFQSNSKECSNYHIMALISHASKVMLKILQARLQQNRELPDVQVGFRKGRETKDQIANIRWIIRKAREFQKSIYFCFVDSAKAFDCVGHNKLWKILTEMGYQTTWPASWETCMQLKKEQLEMDMEQQSGSKLGKEYVKAVCCHPLI